jgi:hypothetical protein
MLGGTLRGKSVLNETAAHQRVLSIVTVAKRERHQ